MQHRHANMLAAADGLSSALSGLAAAGNVATLKRLTQEQVDAANRPGGAAPTQGVLLYYSCFQNKVDDRVFSDHSCRIVGYFASRAAANARVDQLESGPSLQPLKSGATYRWAYQYVDERDKATGKLVSPLANVSTTAVFLSQCCVQ